MSAAVTTPALDFPNFNHSIPSSFFSITNHFRFNIISITLSLIPGKFEYSCVTPLTFTQVTLVHGILESKTLLKELPNVTPYHLGSGDILNNEIFPSKSFCDILGTQILL
jgi:hypothetical protein